ncbi:NYN domain-containing protein [Deinococcus rubellus]|uniref:NYN domain-containing protein n=1 Tax=Deinococcus rubellus TaxID=1889240 RepID=A0ABY5YHN9_9DEIO|nr:NYN domain-containing protein [Deinococcus rubellus]UWX64607.1 NYN domain-containing protein [Deinococcus rubellus]
MEHPERIGLFIDGANVYAAAKRLGWNFDHRKILEHFAGLGRLYNAFYYTAVPTPVDDKQKRFIDALTYMGYTVRTRTLRENTDEHGDTHRRANLDIEIVTDLLTTADLYDVAVLLTGDGDFERPVEALRTRGKRVIVASIPEMTSYELRNAADEYVDFKDIRAAVERPGYRLPSEGGNASRDTTARTERTEPRPFYVSSALDTEDDR